MTHFARGALCSLPLTGWLAAAEPPGKTTLEAEAELLRGFSIEQLMQLKVTTVSRTPSTVAHSPAAIFVITPEMIRRSGATAIPELFRMVPGMNVARIDGNKWAVSARGFNQRLQDKLLVQVDGRTVYNPIFSGVYWDAVDYPLEDIESIEVIRGPGASVWGANAVNGIINIITKSATETQGGLVSGGGGTTEQGFGTFRYGGKVGDDLFYRFYGKGFTRDQTFAQVGDPHDGWWGGSGGLRLDWKPSDQNTLTFDGGYLHSVTGRRDERPQVAAPFSFLNLENQNIDAGHVLGRWTHMVDADNSWSVQAYWDRFSLLLDNLPIPLRVDTYDVDFQHQFPLGERQKLVYGAGYRYMDTFVGSSGRDNGFAVLSQPSNYQLHVFSAFLQDQIALVPERLELTLGSKFEHNDFTGFEVQPTARLLWTPTPGQSIWAAASRAVRTPNVLEDGIHVTLLPSGTNYHRTIPNRDLQAEDIMAYELGYRVQATPKLSADLALFYHEYNNLRVNVPGATFVDPSSGATILPVVAQNGMKGETYGAELGVQWQGTESWRLQGAYTLLKMNLHRPAGLSAEAEAAEGQSPQQQIYLQSSWNLPRNMEFDLIGRFVDALQRFTGERAVIDAYLSLDARLAWRPRKNLTLELIGQNLLDNHHPEFGTSILVKAPVAEPRRGVYGKVTWQF